MSILLPTYNGERHLQEQLRSILNQSFDDFELLVVDDGSSDGTVSIVAEHARRDPRLRLLPATGNLGQKARLLQLVGEACAPLVSFSDQDDIWHADRTRCLVEGLGEAQMSYGRSELVDAAGRPLGTTLIEQVGYLPDPGDRLVLLFKSRVSAHCSLARREAVGEMAFRRYQPFDWLLGVEAAFAGGLVYVSDALVHHRIHGGNQSNAQAGERRSRLQRLRPGPLYLQLHEVMQDRSIFVELMEHLSHSPLLAPETRRRLLQVALRCRGEWFLPGTGMPFDNPKLRRNVLDALRPFAGSDRDWAIAVEFITRMTRSPLHPAALARTARLVLGKDGPTAR